MPQVKNEKEKEWLFAVHGAFSCLVITWAWNQNDAVFQPFWKWFEVNARQFGIDFWRACVVLHDYLKEMPPPPEGFIKAFDKSIPSSGSPHPNPVQSIRDGNHRTSTDYRHLRKRE
jgi:hypothetical protein